MWQQRFLGGVSVQRTLNSFSLRKPKMFAIRSSSLKASSIVLLSLHSAYCCKDQILLDGQTHDN